MYVLGWGSGGVMAGATKLHPETPQNTPSAAMISTRRWGGCFPKLPTAADDLNGTPAQVLAGPGDGQLSARTRVEMSGNVSNDGEICKTNPNLGRAAATDLS
jgi:hypothetical protein